MLLKELQIGGICTNQSILAFLVPNTYATLKLCFIETCINSHEIIALSTTTQAQPMHQPWQHLHP
jgi:hypothetical protein